MIQGVSDAGKTAICTELQRRGDQAIHGDRELVYRGDPQSGLPMTPETGTSTTNWMSAHQAWYAEKVQGFVADPERRSPFSVAARGNSPNLSTYLMGCLA